jgi:hypothetical protein
VNTRSTNPSQLKQRLVERVVLKVFLWLAVVGLAVGLAWLGIRALEARGRFAAPASFLLLCFAFSFAWMSGVFWILRWRVWSVETANISYLYKTFFVNGFTMLNLLLFPKVAVGWFDIYHKLAWPALKDVEAQAQFTFCVGFVMFCPVALYLRRASERSLDKPSATSNNDSQQQKPS